MALITLQTEGGKITRITFEGFGWKAHFVTAEETFRFEPKNNAVPSTQPIEIPLNGNGWIDIGGAMMTSTEQERYVKNWKEKQVEET